jgi:diguanylate cyclase (GGDEF)-like protein/PAS domain S-box-containing protein
MDSATRLDDRGYGGARLAVPLLLTGAVAGLDLTLSDVTLLGWLAVPPLLASTMITRHGTTLISAMAGVLAVVLGAPEGIFGTPDHLLRVGVVLTAAGLAVALSRMRAEKDLAAAHAREASELRAAMLDSALDCVICMDQEGRIVEFNAAAERTFGYGRHEAIGREMAALILPPELRQAQRDGLRQFLDSGDSTVLDQRIELDGMRADGSRFPVELTVSCTDGRQGPLFTGFLRDITERKRFQEELRRKALQDPLTGLPNRSLFMDRLELALRRLPRAAGRVAVFFIDFDRFKEVNDTYGHAAGDELLVTAARRWSDAIRTGDTLGRISGDEFTLVCEGLTGSDEAAAIADRLLDGLARPIRTERDTLRSSVSIGIAIAGDDGATADWLLSVADGAMYQAKRRGGGRYALLDGNFVRMDTPQEPRRAAVR